MRLKRLLVHGFKSFADRTTLTFEGHGVTSIVGPNGCGKSNVIDAVKWVLGEQRPTSLRGKEMMDVIFNGTVRRPPMGLCEGTLVFDNESATLPIDATEVEVTRRVFRSGETEYLINGRPTRLKDVRDLFAGTGIGYGGYGFMEQGKIDSVLASNPLERRRVFEEAAGISRFRARRRETELKLKRVEDNLTRLSDIVDEITRQIRSLKIHAGKARSHREMTTRIRDLQIRLNRHRYVEIKSEQADLAQSFGALEEQREALQAEQQGVRGDVREVEQDLQGRMEAVGDARTAHAELTGRIDTLREKVGLHQGYRKETSERLQNREAEIHLLEDKLAKTREELVLNARERENALRDAESASKLEGQRDQAVRDQEARTGELSAAAAKAEEQVKACDGRLAEAAHEQARLEAELQHLAELLAGFEERRRRLDAERDGLKQALQEKSGQQAHSNSALEEERQLLAREELAADGLETRYIEAADRLADLQARLSRVDMRLEVLRGLMEKREGLQEGVRVLLDHRRQHPEFLPGCRGLLLENFEVDLAEAAAVEVALGDLASAIVVENLTEALEGLRFLEERGLGGAVFLALDRFTAGPGTAPLGVRPVEDACAPLLQVLMGDLEVVGKEDLEQRLAGQRDLGALMVSAEGVLVREGRLVSAPKGGSADAGLVVLQAELRDLERSRPGLEGDVQAAARESGDLRQARDGARARVKTQSVALVQQEGEAARLDQEVVRHVHELERLDGEAEVLHADLRKSRGHEGTTRERLQEVGRHHQAAQKTLEAAEGDLGRQRAEVQAQTQRMRHAQEERETVRLERTRLEERGSSLADRGRDLEVSVGDVEDRCKAAREEIEELHESQDRVARMLEEEQARLQGLFEEAGRGQEVVAEKEQAAGEVRQRLQGLVARLEEVESRLTEVSDRVALSRGREGELKAAMEGLVERTRDELEVEIEELLALEEEPEAEPEAEPTDWKAVERQVRELRDRIARLGNVNLAAVEELEEAEERASFIFREKEDLDTSREQLKKVLRDIEVRSTALFIETFEKVRGHFSDIFRKLFGGGKAEILLENEQEPLESGIEIKARPPGKELRSITLLSGGERTMTAVALLFAIFRANPAPCAFLDEVDAALDEDNTERFCRMLEEFMALSQFVIVTHSRRTMEHADQLVGVTMPERGVSRPVAVLLEQVTEDGHIKPLEHGHHTHPTAQRLEVAQAARRAQPAAKEAEEAADEPALLSRLLSKPRLSPG